MRAVSLACLLITALPASAFAQDMYLHTPANTPQMTHPNNAATHETADQYTNRKILSIWLSHFLLYPPEARVSGTEGTVLMHIRVDDKGNIPYYGIQKNSGFPILDSAAIDMMRRASPLYAPLFGFKAGEMQEFDVSVIFHNKAVSTALVSEKGRMINAADSTSGKPANAAVPIADNTPVFTPAGDCHKVQRQPAALSAWINRFQLYPPQAMAAGIQGVVTMRLRIDDKGNILRYTIDKSSGFPIIDRAAMDMMRRATPLPEPLPGFKPGEVREFLMGMNFHKKGAFNPPMPDGIKSIYTTNSGVSGSVHALQSTNSGLPAAGKAILSTLTGDRQKTPQAMPPIQ